MTNQEWLLGLDFKQLQSFIKRTIQCDFDCPWQSQNCMDGKCMSAIWTRLNSNERTSMPSRYEYIKTLSDDDLGDWVEKYLGIGRAWLMQEHIPKKERENNDKS